MGTCSRFNQERQKHQFSKIKLKPGQPISVHVDFAKIIQGKLGLFKAVPITFIAMISSFSILGHAKENFIKLICIVCSFHLVKCALSNCVLLLFGSIFSFYLASISHVSLGKGELGFLPN